MEPNLIDMKQRLTHVSIKKYLKDTYGVVRHTPWKLRSASDVVAKRYGCKNLQIFFFMIENRPIDYLHTHSYGFLTSLGRQIKSEFTQEYNQL